MPQWYHEILGPVKESRFTLPSQESSRDRSYYGKDGIRSPSGWGRRLHGSDHSIDSEPADAQSYANWRRGLREHAASMVLGPITRNASKRRDDPPPMRMPGTIIKYATRWITSNTVLLPLMRMSREIVVCMFSDAMMFLARCIDRIDMDGSTGKIS
jgi:hypothetical protein